MERRKAITTAAAASLTLLAGAAGIALNSGIVGASGDHNVGQVSPVKTTNPPVTVYVNDPATAAATPAPQVQSTDSQPIATSAASSYQDDERDEHDGDGSGERYEHDSGDHYDGAENDD